MLLRLLRELRNVDKKVPAEEQKKGDICYVFEVYERIQFLLTKGLRPLEPPLEGNKRLLTLDLT